MFTISHNEVATHVATSQSAIMDRISKSDRSVSSKPGVSTKRIGRPMVG